MYTLQEPNHGKRRYVLVKMRPNIAMATHSNAIKRYWKPTPVSSWIKNETFDCITAALWACVFVCTCGADFSSTMNNRHWEKSVFLLWAVYDTRRNPLSSRPDWFAHQLLKKLCTGYDAFRDGIYLIQFVTSLNNNKQNERKKENTGLIALNFLLNYYYSKVQGSSRRFVHVDENCWLAH
jgi:hypothetical protein